MPRALSRFADMADPGFGANARARQSSSFAGTTSASPPKAGACAGLSSLAASLTLRRTNFAQKAVKLGPENRDSLHLGMLIHHGRSGHIEGSRASSAKRGCENSLHGNENRGLRLLLVNVRDTSVRRAQFFAQWSTKFGPGFRRWAPSQSGWWRKAHSRGSIARSTGSGLDRA
jgi:hypothetical protein